MSRWLLISLLTLPGGALAATGGPDAFGYRFVDSDELSGPAHTYEDLSLSLAATQLSLSDDDFAQVPLGFSFPFYGDDVPGVVVNSNGALRMDAPTGWTSYGNVCLPVAPTSLIAGFWDDLNPSAGGEVLWEVRGQPGQRRFVVQWHDVPRYGTVEEVDFQIVLFESGGIELRYNTLANLGSSATVGIQGDTASFLSYSCNQAALSEGLTVRFDSCAGVDADGDGFTDCEECDDDNASILPGAADTCDGVDDNCDGADGIDTDHDGFGTCGVPDCDENDGTVFPGAFEQICDGIDQDCDPSTLDDPPDDLDGDGVTVCYDLCIGDDASGDTDLDGICDDVDACPVDGNDDSDGDGVCDGADLCVGDDIAGDFDLDGVCDDVDACFGFPNSDRDRDSLCDAELAIATTATGAVQFSVHGGPPQSLVSVLASPAGVGPNQRCLPNIPSLCTSLIRPIVLGTVRTDDQGVGSITLPIPAALPASARFQGFWIANGVGESSPVIPYLP